MIPFDILLSNTRKCTVAANFRNDSFDIILLSDLGRVAIRKSVQYYVDMLSQARKKFCLFNEKRRNEGFV